MLPLQQRLVASQQSPWQAKPVQPPVVLPPELPPELPAEVPLPVEPLLVLPDPLVPTVPEPLVPLVPTVPEPLVPTVPELLVPLVPTEPEPLVPLVPDEALPLVPAAPVDPVVPLPEVAPPELAVVPAPVLLALEIPVVPETVPLETPLVVEPPLVLAAPDVVEDPELPELPTLLEDPLEAATPVPELPVPVPTVAFSEPHAPSHTADATNTKRTQFVIVSHPNDQCRNSKPICIYGCNSVSVPRRWQRHGRPDLILCRICMSSAPASPDKIPTSIARYTLLREFEAGQKGQLRRMLAEALGTFALTAVDAGGAMIASLDPAVTFAARSVASGLLVVSMCYALGNVSGAHFNPAVTLGFALRRVFPWRFVPAYWLAQVGGALLAAGMLRLMLGPIAHLGTTEPSVDAGTAVAMEALLTFLLVTVILSTATRYKLLAPTAPLASGATVALCGLFSRPITGASMNPARSLGPALISPHLAGYWIYVVGPFCGSIAAYLIVSLVHPIHHPEEREAAAGG